MIRERTRAGLARARAQGKRLGRPPLTSGVSAPAVRARWPKVSAFWRKRQSFIDWASPPCNEEGRIAGGSTARPI